MDLAAELYEQMEEQAYLAKDIFEKGEMGQHAFIDWCKDLDKQVATLGVYIYVLKQFKKLTEMLSKDASGIQSHIEKLSKKLMEYYSNDEKLFVTQKGQISVHSQIWAVLSEVMKTDESKKLLLEIKNRVFEYFIHTPYMMHYYIEALYNCGLKEEAIALIKDFWGQIADFGFDCCIEVFNPKNHFESPYNSPETNSACHAWSCTPAYWIHRYYNEK